MADRKPNVFIADSDLGICRIATSLTKKMNRDIDVWETDTTDIELHEFEVIINNDPGLIELLKRDYLIFYNNSNDVRRSNAQNPQPTPFTNVGYFWAMDVHTKKRTPLARLVWEYRFGFGDIPPGLVIDHGNDMQNLCIYSNITPMTQGQNVSKLRYPRRNSDHYSVTMVSHPEGGQVKLIRFKDDIEKTQELLVYDTTQGLDCLLNDLNSFKKVSGDASRFKQYFYDLKANSKNHIFHSEQRTTGDAFKDEIFHYSINWENFDIVYIIGLYRKFWQTAR